MSKIDELKARVEAKKKELEADFHRTRGEGDEGLKSLKSRLGHGWKSVTNEVTARLNKLLKK